MMTKTEAIVKTFSQCDEVLRHMSEHSYLEDSEEENVVRTFNIAKKMTIKCAKDVRVIAEILNKGCLNSAKARYYLDRNRRVVDQFAYTLVSHERMDDEYRKIWANYLKVSQIILGFGAALCKYNDFWDVENDRSNYTSDEMDTEMDQCE